MNTGHDVGGNGAGHIMVNLLLALVLGVVVAAQPVTTLRSIELLNTPYMSRARSWRFIGGLATTLGVVGLGAAVAARLYIRGSGVPTTAIDTTDVVLGGITLIGVVIALVMGRSNKRIDRLDSTQPHTSFYLFGIRTLAVNISVVALYVAAVNELGTSGRSWITIEILLIVVTALALLPGVLPLLIESTVPVRADYFIDRLRRLCTTTGPIIAMSAWAVAGVGLLVRGLVN